MKQQCYKILTGNEAVAEIAFKTNEVFPIYPITPSSEMSELVEKWSAIGRENSFGSIPTVFQMQSEAGVAGAMHGALQTGSLSSTFTASQGLLLMLPNMYKIAGELTPNVIHVATRTIATHALSIFSDHSDIMAVRNSGYAILGGSSAQEAHDLALISQAATLESRVPFIHFFDGLRISHETSKIECISDAIIQKFIKRSVIDNHLNRALTPDKPVIRGTAQDSKTYFESCEARNQFYDKCPDIVQAKMNEFANLTGRQYKLFEYFGHPEATEVIISMGSSCQTIEQTISRLNAEGKKYGSIRVKLFRPFSTKHLIEALPKTCKSIAVLDRSKEPGASGDPLFLDVSQSFLRAFQDKTIKTLPKIIGGRYGLSSKEFTPDNVCSVFKNLECPESITPFTVGIIDDITNLSLLPHDFKIKSSAFEALFYHTKNEKQLNKIDGLKRVFETSDSKYFQYYSEIDYRKYNSRLVGNLRIDSSPVEAPYLVQKADFVFCDSIDFIENDNVLSRTKNNGTLLIDTTLSPKDLLIALSAKCQRKIASRNIQLAG